VPTLRLCVLYGSQKKQQLLPYKTLRDGFYNRGGVFTARYALSPYIKEMCFVFKGLIEVSHVVLETFHMFKDLNSKYHSFITQSGKVTTCTLGFPMFRHISIPVNSLLVQTLDSVLCLSYYVSHLHNTALKYDLNINR
jgi:hypothetical protein